MKSKAKSNLIILGILLAFLPIITSNISYFTDNNNKTLNYCDDFTLDKKNLKISAVSEKIHIDNNWTAAKITGICTGNGTYSEPYVIEDLEIDGGGSGSCILIENSNEYFRIENCTVYNSVTVNWGDGGILLNNTNNGLLIDNDCSSNSNGISLLNSGNNTISGNSVENNGGGIFFDGGYNNTVSGNFACYNNYTGIYLWTGTYNNISGNIASYNGQSGIMLFTFGCHDNLITANILKENQAWAGIYINGGDDNDVYLNCFIDNKLNAYDGGMNNQWDNGTIGNYWSNYTGSDSNGDGIGDIPYNITGTAGSQDNFPLKKCPFSTTQDGGGFPLELVIIISVISGGAAIGVATILLIRRKRKRIDN